MRDAESEKFSDGDLQPRVAGICMMGVDFHRHSAMVGTVEKGARSRPRSRGKRLSAQPLVSAHPDTRVQSCGTTYAPGCRMVRPDGGTCFWRSTSLTVVWGPHHDALTPPQPCVCVETLRYSLPESIVTLTVRHQRPHRRVVSHITCVWDRGATAGRPIGKLLGVRARSTSLIVLWGHRLLAPGTIQPWNHYG